MLSRFVLDYRFGFFLMQITSKLLTQGYKYIYTGQMF